MLNIYTSNAVFDGTWSHILHIALLTRILGVLGAIEKDEDALEVNAILEIIVAELNSFRAWRPSKKTASHRTELCQYESLPLKCSLQMARAPLDLSRLSSPPDLPGVSCLIDKSSIKRQP